MATLQPCPDQPVRVFLWTLQIPEPSKGLPGGWEAGAQASGRASPSAWGRSAAPLQSDRETEAAQAPCREPSPLPPPPHRARGLPGRVSSRIRVADPQRGRTQPENRGSEAGGMQPESRCFQPRTLGGSGSSAPRSRCKACGSGSRTRPTSGQAWPQGPSERPVCGGTFGN